MDKQENSKTEEMKCADQTVNIEEPEAKKTSVAHRVFSIVGIVITAIILPILILNIVFLVESYMYPDEVPGVFGITPMVVVTDSMDPTISAGDMIVDKKVEPETIKVGDIISFFDPTRRDHKVVMTHRVIAVYKASGELKFATKGDANNISDPIPVPAGNLVGVYRQTIPYLGSVVLFMKTPQGVFLTVILPILLIVAYDLIRKRIHEKKAEKRLALASAVEVKEKTV